MESAKAELFAAQKLAFSFGAEIKKLKAELDRMLELFKKMEVEKEMSDAINKLDSLAKKQEELSKETEKNENASPEKQQELQGYNHCRHVLQTTKRWN
jgi:hypothetical protein